MMRTIIAGYLLGLSLAAGAAAQPPKGSEIDFERAKVLLDKEKKGEKLTADERAYLARAKEAFRQRSNQPNPGPARGGKDSTGMEPLTDLGTEKYKDETGGSVCEGIQQPHPVPKGEGQ